MWLPSIFRRTPKQSFDDRFNKHNTTGVYLTPDAVAMGARSNHLVFLYDNMMKGRVNYPLIEHLVIKPIGGGLARISVEAYVREDTEEVVAFLTTNHRKPDWCDRNDPYGAPIRGWLLKMSSDAIFELDKIYRNNVYYERIEISCELWKNLMPYGFTAWMYLGIRDKWDIDGGYEWKPLTMNRPNRFTPDYHYYNSAYKLATRKINQLLWQAA